METDINVLVVATVVGGQAATLTQLLTACGFTVTEIASQLSLVDQPVTSLLVGTHSDRLEALMQVVRECCPSRIQYVPARMEPGFNAQPVMVEALQGGASVFAFQVERYLQF